ncbi:hypothetical protein Cgig2_004817 [Carnegiea gigantea]|uniref:Uncharacterized protein n=1 Tax=Carnegiea gigantea TaxID=171969 RepID=A0A9Q1QS66_9CARY|nr:hypothetical protein Cgig2_004817 [Carnegiea gigantea]
MKLFTALGGGQLWLNHHGRALFPLPNRPRTTLTSPANLIYDDEEADAAGAPFDDGSDHGSADEDENLPRARGGPRRTPGPPDAGPSHPSSVPPAGPMSPSLLQTVLDRLDQLHVQNQEIFRNQQHMAHLWFIEVDENLKNKQNKKADHFDAKAGADGLFVKAPHNDEELREIGRKVKGYKIASMIKGGKTVEDPFTHTRRAILHDHLFP